MTRARCILLLSFVLALSSCDGLSGKDDRYSMGELIWSRDLADPEHIDITKPVIDGEVVYVVAGKELLALTLADGTLRWKRQLTARKFSQNMVHDSEALYLASWETVEAYNKRDGSLRWRMAPDMNIQPRTVLTETETHIYPSQSDGYVGRIRKRDGQVDQKIHLTDLKPENDQQSAGTLILSDDNYLYVPTAYFQPSDSATGGNVLAYAASTGEFRWGYAVPWRYEPIPGLPGQYWKMPADTIEGAIWESSVIIATSTSVIALDRFSGELRWEQLFGGNVGFWLGFALAYGKVYVGGTEGIVWALDPDTGEILWESQGVKGSVITLLEVEDGRIYFDTTIGTIAILDADTGQVLWQGSPPDHRATNGYAEFLSPVAAKNGYMVNVGSIKIYCLAVR